MPLRAITLALLTAAAAAAQPAFFLHDGDRVVFYGDSITDQRLYTTFTETYVVTCYPKMNVAFVHSGWGGDRVTGGGGGPVDLRLERDAITYHPTVMTIMLGMNDGSYRAFDPKIFETYSTGYEHIVDAVRKALPGIRITVIEPSPYDDVTRTPAFDGGYNAVLERYGEYLKGLAARNHLTVADLNAPVVADLQRAKEIDPAAAAKLIPDRVHPGPAGHLLMAEALLKAWNAPPLVSSVEIDAASGKVSQQRNTQVRDVKNAAGISWTEQDEALPMPIDFKDAGIALAMRSSDFVDALNREMLTVTGLADGKYTLKIDDAEVGTFNSVELSKGLNLATLPTPMMKQAMDVHALTLKHNNVHFARWRTVQVPLQDINTPNKEQALAALDKLEDDLVKEQRAAAQPRAHTCELTPVQ